jgi:nucleoside-diphosphate-sugar epimerase
MSDRHVVLGAGGNIGTAVVHELVNRGKSIGVSYQQWSRTYPVVMRNLVAVAADLGSQTRVVYADNLYCYGREGAMRGPLREDTPHLAAGKKGKLRSELIEQPLQAHREGRLRATIGQASDFFGPDGDYSILDFFLFRPLLDGRRVSFLADLDRRHSFIFLPDFARFLVKTWRRMTERMVRCGFYLTWRC